MGYDITAVVAERGLIERTTADLPEHLVAVLPQDYAMLLLTDDLCDLLGPGDERLGFWLPFRFEDRLAEWSTGGSVAYIEADFFGGVGSQWAAVWADGELEYGPLHLEIGEDTPSEGTPISRALRRIGVVADEGRDEFQTLGLNRYRHEEDWIAAVRGGVATDGPLTGAAVVEGLPESRRSLRGRIAAAWGRGEKR